ncbi:MAG: iron-containing alcohol dehydrogenase family protein, partial [Oscillatoriales cyanobacterium RM1_1_9]|nr:iron-containing alcohol dehydrogenase family protein [Oscillatoriales cyanobacterium RM1_1_9]
MPHLSVPGDSLETKLDTTELDTNNTSLPIAEPAIAGFCLTLAPAQVMRGSHIVTQAGQAITQLGVRPLVIGGNHT